MSDNLTVTIILPVRNEGSSLAKVLDQVLAQDYLWLKEILIADGLSTDNTREIVLEYQKNHNEIHLIDNTGKIVPTGMNAALRLAQGAIIVRVDGHTLIATNYVSKCVETLLRSGADNVGGPMVAEGEGSFGKAVVLATSTPFGVGGARFHYSEKEEWVDTVYMGAWPYKVFERVGLFDEELVRDQDDEFNYRLRKFGGKIFLTPQIRSRYTVRSTPSALWKQYFQYGFYKVRVLQKHPSQMSMRQFIPPIFVMALLVSILFSIALPSGWKALILVGGSYLLANLVASLWMASKNGLRHMVLLPICFAILHLSYGLGFWAGFVKFWNRWGDK